MELFELLAKYMSIKPTMIGAAIVTAGFVRVIAPYFDVEQPNAFQRFFAGRRVLLLVWIVGSLISPLAELNTPEFRWAEVPYRAMIVSLMATGVFENIKNLFKAVKTD